MELEIEEAEAANTPVPQIRVIKKKLEIFKRKAERLEDQFEGLIQLEIGKQNFASADEVADGDSKVMQWVDGNFGDISVQTLEPRPKPQPHPYRT